MADEKLVDESQDLDKVGKISAGISSLHNETYKGKYMLYARLYTSDDGQKIELEAKVHVINSDDVRATPLSDFIIYIILASLNSSYPRES